MKKIKCLMAMLIAAISLLLIPSLSVGAEEYNGDDNLVTEEYYTYNALTGEERLVEKSYKSAVKNDLESVLDDTSGIYGSDAEVVSNNTLEEYGGENSEYDDLIGSDVKSDEDTSDSGSCETASIYGSTDDRWRITNPSNYGKYRNTCSLKIKHSDKSYYLGTGFVLSNSAIATAGHCVYSDGNWVESVEVRPAYSNGSKPYGSVTGYSFECGSAWKNNGDVNQDWGIIKVSNKIPSLCGYLGLR